MRLTFCAAAVICWQAFTGIRLTEKGGLELNVEVDAELKPPELPAELKGRFHGAAFVGAGAYGSVFRATDTDHKGIAVAVKVLQTAQRKCIKECSIVQNLMRACTPPHDQSCLGASHIVRCLEQSDPSSGISWMSTELVEGKDFAYHFGTGGLPPNWNIQLGQQVIAQFVAALNFMERGGVSHNDLSDHFGNVMVANLDSAPNLHIIDFGRASVGSPVSDGADVLWQGNDKVRLWLWPLMILPSDKKFREGGACLDPLKFEAHLATLLFDDSKPLSQTAEGSGISTDEMEILLLAADDELQSSSLRELAQSACHAIDGNEEPCPFPLGPDLGDIAVNYCYNWPIASTDSSWKRRYSKSEKNTWLDDRWEKVCKGLPGGKACDERPAKDVATFVASVWTLMFKMQASIDEYWNACPKCRKRSLNARWKQLCEKSTCAIDKTVRDEIERLYEQQAIDIDIDIDCDAGSCTIKKSEEEKVTIELVCTEQCNTYGTKTFGLFNDSIPCCLTPEIPKDEDNPLISDTYPGIMKWRPILKVFPDHSQRGKVVKQMWQGLFSADGLSFLRKLIVDDAGVGVLIKEPFVHKVLATEPSTNQAADAYAAYPAKICYDGVPAKGS